MEAFVRVADAGSFTAAARNWGCSKAAMSKYVSELEEHLGVALLRRTTRSLSLTEAGRRYRQRCLGVLEEIESAETDARDDTLAPRGVLRVSAPPGFMSRHGALMTTQFTDRYPDIRLDLDLTHRMIDLVEEGIDVAIRVTDPGDSTLVARRLGPAPVIAVASPDYLAERGTPCRPLDLADHDCLVDTNFRDGGRWPFVYRRKREVVEVDGPFRVNSPETLRDLAVANRGIALVAHFVVANSVECGELVEVLPSMVDLHWSVYAVYPRRRYLPARVRAFVDHLAKGLKAGGRG